MKFETTTEHIRKPHQMDWNGSRTAHVAHEDYTMYQRAYAASQTLIQPFSHFRDPVLFTITSHFQRFECIVTVVIPEYLYKHNALLFQEVTTKRKA